MKDSSNNFIRKLAKGQVEGYGYPGKSPIGKLVKFDVS
jgi:hypothetical protein